jgi:diketogulonate reductase-like aldo/keto reductase
MCGFLEEKERKKNHTDVDIRHTFQLMHWPQASHPDTGKAIPYGESPTFVETWKSMEKLLSDKRCRAIG